jgi:UDPglucose 6-dehydrogenase
VAGKSTVPVGTAARLADLLRDAAPQAMLAWNPEFLREGFALQDTVSPDRLVYGVAGDETGATATALLDEVYSAALSRETPRLVLDYATAELVKVAANAFLATKISFINAMAEIAEATGADVTLLADAIGYDARIGRRFLNSGLGFGGGCLPKDIRAFQARANELGVGQSLAFLGEVDAINLRRRDRMVDLTREVLGGTVAGRRIAVLGLAFKPDSDDVRDSPALDVAARLGAEGAIVVATDPRAIETSRALHPELTYVDSAEAASEGADAVLVLTEWAEYRDLAPAALGGVASMVVLDGRNCLSRERW